MPMPAGNYKIIDVTVIDVEKRIAVPGQTVTIVGDRIDKIGAQVEPGISEQVKTINGRGLYLMPWLVDAHVHYLEAPIFGRLMIASGALCLFETWVCPTNNILKLRDELNLGETLGPEMVATGAMLDGVPPVIPTISMGHHRRPKRDGQRYVGQAEAGVDMIKVYSNLDQEVFLAIVDEARKLGLKVVGHVPDSIYIEDAAAAGLQQHRALVWV